MLLSEMTCFPHAACVLEAAVCQCREKVRRGQSAKHAVQAMCALTPPTTAVQRAASEGIETSDPISMSLARLGLVPMSVPCCQEHGHVAYACCNCNPTVKPDTQQAWQHNRVLHLAPQTVGHRGQHMISGVLRCVLW